MVTWKQRLQGATLYALKFIKTIKSKENKTMENVFYKSYKELVSEYFGIDYKVGENAPKLSKQLSKKVIKYTQEELQVLLCKLVTLQDIAIFSMKIINLKHVSII